MKNNKPLLLGELEEFTDLPNSNIISHISYWYNIPKEELTHFEVLIAYESTNNWHLEAKSYFLLRNKNTGSLYENIAYYVQGNFHNQWQPKLVTLEYLKGNEFSFYSTFYKDDDQSDEIKEAIQNWIKTNL